ncbi:restriction endonuclease subunit S [Glaesserella parasuis]|uniref:Type I restriction-modification system, S subunit/Type I restriction modification DNA specificity domain-containing protein n=1 Tax=Glaesserella parasuis serovar 5 (strain SH0165) TaxID=557723 RepID=B8F3Y1_GLAP5|nr:restriction endonuclease subunit S [Glaesserella parasuis]ACL32033.1 Type I restriction-modification system, S subunit/Type I restriction modification DNA specificity domain-containing protein [Glaesserella parasuis SH0165]MDG6868736.1 restriction endonuclease subunit S [Glaesserella parasuis]
MSSLSNLTIHSIGGGWGKDVEDEGLELVAVIRGTDIPNLEINNIQGVPFRYETQKKIQSRLLQVGDLVIEISGGSASSKQRTGRCLYITDELLKNLGGKVIPASFCKLLRLDRKKVNSKYVYYQIKAMHLSDEIASFENQSTGISNFQFNRFIDEIRPSILDIEVQNKIVNFLEKIDLKIINNININQTLEQIAQTIFKSWFIDFDPVHAKANALASGQTLEQATQAAMAVISGKNTQELHRLQTANPEQYQQLWEIAEAFPRGFDEEGVPRGWEITTIDENYNVVMGQSPKGETYNEESNGTLFYQGRAEFGWRYPEPRLYTTDPKRIAKKSNILMSVRAPVGDLNVALEDCCIGRGLAALSHKSNSLSFGLYQIKNLQNEFDVFNGEGTVFGSINQKDLKSIRVINPSSKIIKLFDDVCSTNDLLIENLSREILSLRKIRDELLPMLLSGEV